MLDKYNSQSTIINEDGAFNASSTELNLDAKYGTLKRSRRKAKNVAVNTSRIAFNTSFELIQPITHLQFPSRKPTVPKYSNDGLDEEATAPMRFTDVTPIHSSEPKAAKTRIQHKFNASLSRKFQTSHAKIALDPEKIDPMRAKAKYNRIQKAVNINLKHVEANEDLIKRSQRIGKHWEKNDQEDKPVAKKSFKISNVGTRLSQSKLVSKDQIIADAKKMIEQNCHQLSQKVSNCFQQSLVKSSKAQSLENSKGKLERSKVISPEISAQNILTINLKTPISILKRILIEGQEQLHLNFVIPPLLFNFPAFDTGTNQLKQRMSAIFGEIGIEIQIVSIKKHVDRIQLRNKNLCILWGFDGKGYFGQWRGEQIMADLNKHGLGFQWCFSKQEEYMYYGEFRDNKKEGYGVMKESDQVFVGCWKDNKKCGWGKLYKDHKLKHKGDFSQD